MDDDDLGLTTEQNDCFWAWLEKSGELKAINAMLAAEPKEPEPGRNDPCWCGSGKKYKKCCLNLPDVLIEPEAPAKEDKPTGAMPASLWLPMAMTMLAMDPRKEGRQ